MGLPALLVYVCKKERERDKERWAIGGPRAPELVLHQTHVATLCRVGSSSGSARVSRCTLENRGVTPLRARKRGVAG